jgi:uncharacterized protein
MARFEAPYSAIVDAAQGGGATDALFELGLMYCSGREVNLDLVEAHKWFNLAALRGNDEARCYRVEISREMTRSEIGRAQKAAREWLTRH